MHLNLWCLNLPQKSHLSKTNCDLEDDAPFSSLRPNLSWGCWLNIKIMVKVLELSKKFPKSFVRQVISFLSFLIIEDSSVLLAWLRFSSRVWIFFFRSSFDFFSSMFSKIYILYWSFILVALKRNHMTILKKNITRHIFFIVWWRARRSIKFRAGFHLEFFVYICHQTNISLFIVWTTTFLIFWVILGDHQTSLFLVTRASFSF